MLKLHNRETAAELLQTVEAQCQSYDVTIISSIFDEFATMYILENEIYF
jgi:hypothetical protein